MEHINIKLQSQYDNLSIDTLIIKPDNIKGIIQFVHGMCEHKERYIPVMEYLAKHHYLCIIHDHRGHGKSILNDNDLGYFYNSKDIGLVEDIELVQQYIKHLYPDIPLYLFGHSMGSLAVRAYIKKYDTHIQGLFVCGSPSFNPLSTIGLSVIRLLTKIKGDHYRNHLVNEMVIGAFNKPFKKENKKNAWICTDSQVVDDYNNNPLCSFSFTMNGYDSLLSLMSQVYSQKNWKINNPNLPIHFISGQYDPCMTNIKMFKQSVELLKQVGYKNVNYKLYNDMRHEILNEPDKQEVYKDILNKIKEWEN